MTFILTTLKILLATVLFIIPGGCLLLLVTFYLRDMYTEWKYGK